MKQNVSETESNWRFRKIVKTFLQNKKAYLMVELPQQHANTTVYWLQTLPLPVVAKSSILNVAEFLDPSLKTLPCTEPSPASCENQYFLLFRNVPTFIESHCIFLTFYSMMKYF